MARLQLETIDPNEEFCQQARELGVEVVVTPPVNEYPEVVFTGSVEALTRLVDEFYGEDEFLRGMIVH